MRDEPVDMIEMLKKQTSSVQTPGADRRDRELQGVHYIDRRGIRTPAEHIRNVQLNLKVSKKFRSRLSQLSVARKLSITEIVVRAVDAYAAKE